MMCSLSWLVAPPHIRSRGGAAAGTGEQSPLHRRAGRSRHISHRTPVGWNLVTIVPLKGSSARRKSPVPKPHRCGGLTGGPPFSLHSIRSVLESSCQPIDTLPSGCFQYDVNPQRPKLLVAARRARLRHFAAKIRMSLPVQLERRLDGAVRACQMVACLRDHQAAKPRAEKASNSRRAFFEIRCGGETVGHGSPDFVNRDSYLSIIFDTMF
jgi:hypothetical protein